ncbi:AAA family ATPase [Calderihabitans maritimus]|uniref:ATPase AAA n=1 Tax=Calderihabitans maritimus TaxID=1246530 RepID=A0A1Z5HSC2_9FIRM|nr:MoxR family ATPase [Calderihabitans maritimus]GAW92180.1 ATPase AAA [Calderihabitans maritimus]
MDIRALSSRIVDNISQVLVGKEEAAKLCLTAILAGGHILLEGGPGVGKTVLAKALARSMGCTYRRIQFTPDLMPSEITGVSIYNQKTGDFEYKPGPVMTQVLLADEINRATPKTQAGLLQAMEEGEISVDGITHSLPRPFVVLATQNPLSYEGVFPLPEGQLDRFALQVNLGYPGFEEEMAMLERLQGNHPLNKLEPVSSPQEILEAQQLLEKVYVHPSLGQYIVTLVQQVRQHPSVLAASPRGTLFLFKCARARAAQEGRNYVTPDDVKELFLSVLGHRLILREGFHQEGGEILREIMEQVPVPVEVNP